MRGTAVADPMALCDYYVTFAFLAGVDPTDHRAAAAGLPGIDGVNLWPRISGSNTSAPRLHLWAGPNVFISGNYKLLLSSAETYAVWTGPRSPNATTEAVKQFFLQWNCSACNPPVVLGRINCSEGCLWDVANDPSEYNELSQALPGKLAELRLQHASVAETLFNPDRGAKDPRACEQALLYGQGTDGCFWGPFAFLNSTDGPTT